MSTVEILLSIVIGLAVNECCNLSPWIARHLARWATCLRYRDEPERLVIRLPEMESVIQQLPGKLTQLVMALPFVFTAVGYHLKVQIRSARRRPQLNRKSIITDHLPIFVPLVLLAIEIPRRSGASLILQWSLVATAIAGSVSFACYLAHADKKACRNRTLLLAKADMITSAEAHLMIGFLRHGWRHAHPEVRAALARFERAIRDMGFHPQRYDLPPTPAWAMRQQAADDTVAGARLQ